MPEAPARRKPASGFNAGRRRAALTRATACQQPRSRHNVADAVRGYRTAGANYGRGFPASQPPNVAPARRKPASGFIAGRRRAALTRATACQQPRSRHNVADAVRGYRTAGADYGRGFPASQPPNVAPAWRKLASGIYRWPAPCRTGAGHSVPAASKSAQRSGRGAALSHGGSGRLAPPGRCVQMKRPLLLDGRDHLQTYV
jgi:hypothetical protein